MPPPLSHFNCFNEGRDYCEECGRCDYLCVDHLGCTCERSEEEDEYNGSLCTSEVRYAITKLLTICYCVLLQLIFHSDFDDLAILREKCWKKKITQLDV